MKFTYEDEEYTYRIAKDGSYVVVSKGTKFIRFIVVEEIFKEYCKNGGDNLVAAFVRAYGREI